MYTKCVHAHRISVCIYIYIYIYARHKDTHTDAVRHAIQQLVIKSLVFAGGVMSTLNFNIRR